jgi:hypothetical protein
LPPSKNINWSEGDGRSRWPASRILFSGGGGRGQCTSRLAQNGETTHSRTALSAPVSFPSKKKYKKRTIFSTHSATYGRPPLGRYDPVPSVCSHSKKLNDGGKQFFLITVVVTWIEKSRHFAFFLLPKPVTCSEAEPARWGVHSHLLLFRNPAAAALGGSVADRCWT